MVNPIINHPQWGFLFRFATFYQIEHAETLLLRFPGGYLCLADHHRCVGWPLPDVEVKQDEAWFKLITAIPGKGDFIQS